MVGTPPERAEASVDSVRTSDGVRLHVRDEGSGPVVVMVPGWGVSGWWFREQYSEPLLGSFRLVCYDPRGQGDSDKTERGLRVSRLAADLRDVIAATGADRVHLLAWSGGGSTALAYVDLFGTERLASVVLVGAGPKLMKDDTWPHGFADLSGTVDWVTMLRDAPEAAADFVLPTFFSADVSPEVLADARAEMLKSPADILSALSWDFIHQDLRDVLPLIDVPTLLVSGAGDVSVPAGNAPYMAEAIPGSQALLIDDAAHAVFLEQPKQFNAVVADFLGLSASTND
jgi:peroxiredoxin